MLAMFAAISSGTDRSKCEGLYLRYRNLMYSVAYGILHDRRSAEDAVQRAFVKVIDYLEKIGEIHCPKTKGLMVIIIKGIAINEYNRRKRYGETPYDEFYAVPVEDAPPDGVTAAILRLPPLYAEALELRYVQGFSVREIAGLVGVEEAAIQKRITRGREKLREILEGEGYDVP